MGGREGGRERETQRDRQTDRDRDRQTGRDRQTETETHRDRERERERSMHQGYRARMSVSNWMQAGTSSGATWERVLVDGPEGWTSEDEGQIESS